MARRKSRRPQHDQLDLPADAQPDVQPDISLGQTTASHTAAAALSREIELKYAMPDAEFSARFGALTNIAGLALDASQQSVNQDTYVDTPDFTLLRRGLTLRLRTSISHADRGALVTLKSLPLGDGESGPLDRLELEAPPQPGVEAASIPGAPATILPGSLSSAHLPREIHDYLTAHGGVPAALVPYLVLHQTRNKRIGRDAGVAHLETSLDDVTVFAVGNLTPDGQPAQCGRFWEVEFETLIPGDMMTLQHLQTEPIVQELAPLAAGKLQRALAIWAGIEPTVRTGDEHVPAGFGPASHIADALPYMLRSTLVDVLFLEAGVRADQDIEAVHLMRVALRRARTGARFFGTVATRNSTKPKALPRLLQPMKKLAVRLGNVRDLDVALANMGMSGATTAGQHAGSASAHAALTQRVRAVRRLHKWLDGEHHAKLVRRLVKFCAGAACVPGPDARDTDARGFPVATQVRHVLPGLLLNQFLKLRVFEVQVAELGELPAPKLHALRIECKRLRYMLEFSRPLLGAGIVRFLDRLRKLQDTLGRLNDAYVELQRLAGDKDSSDRRRERELARAIKQARRQVPKRFATVIDPKRRHEFILALAAL